MLLCPRLHGYLPWAVSVRYLVAWVGSAGHASPGASENIECPFNRKGCFLMSMDALVSGNRGVRMDRNMAFFSKQMFPVTFKEVKL